MISEKKKIIDNLNINLRIEKIFQTYADFAVTKARRRLAQLKNFFFLDKLIFELALRLAIPEALVRFMTPEELLAALEGQTLDWIEIEKRTDEMFYHVDKVSEEIIADPELISNLNEVLMKKINIPNTNRLFGIAAYGGHVIGKAFTLTRKSEYNDIVIDQDLILVSIEADPDLLPIMKECGAIVTDQGGITCHAAVIAKEFNIPCVTGTQFATTLIEDGDLLDVDADRGIVTILKKFNHL
jgi:phosphohistidine swiveling domain-containing protein